MRASEFLDLELLLRDLNFSSAQQQLQAPDLAFGAGCMLVTRFLVSPSTDLRGRHPVFTQLQLCAPEVLERTSPSARPSTPQPKRCTPRPDGTLGTPPPCAFSSKASLPRSTGSMDNAPSGALSLKRHIAGIAYESVVEPEMYTVAASLDE
eukprot:2339345-Pleurochrysis_carterae.AAC.1